ncbi:hypothetical protein IKE71_00715 [Candidatus Saccharibacteria bacterium]|nr:hypothetical protein [Candidatus Saccharibacteria bacterium]
MEKLKTSLRRFYFRIKHDYFSFDNVIFVIAIAACFFWTYSSLAATSKNWELSQKLEAREKERELLQLEVDTLEVENLYYDSVEYKELSARAKGNKILDGERLVYLPENTESAKSRDNSSEKETLETSDPPKPSNFAEWVSFLFGA